MQGRLKAEEPDKIVYTITLTATVKEWEELREQLSQKYPSGQLSLIISDLLSQARRIYWTEHESK